MQVREIRKIMAYASQVRVRCDAGAFVGNFPVKCTKTSLRIALERLRADSEVPAHYSMADDVLTVGWDR